MTLLPRGLKVHLALGYTDMRKGIDGLTMLIQGVLRQDPFSGHLFVFRGSKANLIKIVFWDGGLCLFTKRLEQSVFLWPPDVDPGETLALSSDRSEDPTCHGMPGQSIGSTALARSPRPGSTTCRSPSKTATPRPPTTSPATTARLPESGHSQPRSFGTSC